jgi:hypothetical protein
VRSASTRGRCRAQQRGWQRRADVPRVRAAGCGGEQPSSRPGAFRSPTMPNNGHWFCPKPLKAYCDLAHTERHIARTRIRLIDAIKRIRRSFNHRMEVCDARHKMILSNYNAAQRRRFRSPMKSRAVELGGQSKTLSGIRFTVSNELGLTTYRGPKDGDNSLLLSSNRALARTTTRCTGRHSVPGCIRAPT